MGVYFYGAGGHAKVVAYGAEKSNLEIKGAFDSDVRARKLLNKYPVHESLSQVNFCNDDFFIVAIGNNLIRKRIVEIDLKGKLFTTMVDPNSVVSEYSEIQEGTVIMAGATINPDVKVGRHSIINTNASVDHDCVIGDYVHISPNAALAGNVTVGEGTHIGIGACVIEGVKIGRWCIVGAGTIVIRDIPDGMTVVGNPGRIIKKVPRGTSI